MVGMFGGTENVGMRAILEGAAKYIADAKAVNQATTQMARTMKASAVSDMFKPISLSASQATQATLAMATSGTQAVQTATKVGKAGGQAFQPIVRDAGAAKKGLDELGKSINDISGHTVKARGLLGQMLSPLTNIGFAIFGVQMATRTIGDLVGAILGSASAWEQYNIQFETLLQSAELGRAKLGELQRFAQATPFTLPEVVEGTRQLLAYGFAAEQVIPILKTTGDAAGLLGKEKLPFIIRALGQMHTATRVNSRDMMQLTEAGIPAWAMLADAIGTVPEELRKMVEQGLVPADAAITVLLDRIEKRFPDGMKKLSKSLEGMLSNLVDWGFKARVVFTTGTDDLERLGMTAEEQAQILSRTGVQTGMFQGIKDQLNSLLTFLNRPEVLAGIASVGAAVGQVFNAMLISFRVAANVVGTAGSTIIAVIQGIAGGFKSLDEALDGGISRKLGDVTGSMGGLEIASKAAGVALGILVSVWIAKAGLVLLGLARALTIATVAQLRFVAAVGGKAFLQAISLAVSAVTALSTAELAAGANAIRAAVSIGASWAIAIAAAVAAGIALGALLAAVINSTKAKWEGGLADITQTIGEWASTLGGLFARTKIPFLVDWGKQVQSMGKSLQSFGNTLERDVAKWRDMTFIDALEIEWMKLEDRAGPVLKFLTDKVGALGEFAQEKLKGVFDIPEPDTSWMDQFELDASQNIGDVDAAIAQLRESLKSFSEDAGKATDPWSAFAAAARDAIQDAQDAIDTLRDHIGLLEDQLRDALDAMKAFSDPRLVGMQAAEDEIFDLEMSLKKAELAELDLGKQARKTNREVTDTFDMLAAQQKELSTGMPVTFQFVLDQIERQRRAQEKQASQQADVDEETEVERLRRLLRMRELQKDITFEPMQRQLKETFETLTGANREITFEQAMAGLQSAAANAEALRIEIGLEKDLLAEAQVWIEAQKNALRDLEVAHSGIRAGLEDTVIINGDIYAQLQAQTEQSVIFNDTLMERNRLLMEGASVEMPAMPMPETGRIPLLGEMALPEMATGGTVSRGGAAVVGERGPEVALLPSGTQILPNSRIQPANVSRSFQDTFNIFGANQPINVVDAIRRYMAFQNITRGRG